MEETGRKVVIYQLLPRLFGNKVTRNKPWGSKEENGVGKFNDISDLALSEIKKLGVTHIWYTGVLHHCLIGDYTMYGIGNDDPDVVKGRAGSPYAIKDYYNVNPDLAVDPSKRMGEFEALIVRTHKAGLKVIIDIVPNHVARNYHSISKPKGIYDFGEDDNCNIEYDRNNNFYYIPGKAFEVPDFEDGFMPLGGEDHPLVDGHFDEFPARWTGNGSRSAKPSVHDWYETVKVNFGIAPDGRYDFDILPSGYENKDVKDHFEFWKDKDVPNSWKKFEHIVHYWIEKGVDGFRYDMAQMVPVEFWSFLNASIKIKNPRAMLISEIYIPEKYRDYIFKGKMDYLYDKVGLYDTLRSIMEGHGNTDQLTEPIEGLADIENHMLHFLENHDEHRLASPEFAGDARKGMPAMVLSATIGTAPTMIYFGQEVGEKGEGDAGFGKTGRTTIFDYWGVPAHQRWMNGGRFDGGLLAREERGLRDFYMRLLNYISDSEVLMGQYLGLHSFNREHSEGYGDKQFIFLRYKNGRRLLVLTNFSQESVNFELKIPASLYEEVGLKYGNYNLHDALGSSKRFQLFVNESVATSLIRMDGYESFLLEC